jgi:hypothetical protein
MTVLLLRTSIRFYKVVKELKQVILKWFKESKTGRVIVRVPRGHLWDPKFQKWYQKGLKGWIWHFLQPKINKDYWITYRSCDFCGEPIKNDVDIYVIRNKMYTEISGRFISKNNTPKDVGVKGKDIVVHRLNKHIVLCLHWDCLKGNEK